MICKAQNLVDSDLVICPGAIVERIFPHGPGTSIVIDICEVCGKTFSMDPVIIQNQSGLSPKNSLSDFVEST